MNPVTVELLEDPAEFARRAGDWILGEPLSANVLAVQLAGLLSGTRSVMAGSVWALVTEPSGVVTEPAGVVTGAAMHTSPVGVFLPRLPDGVADALAAALADAGRPLAGATGEIATVQAFTSAWQRRTGASVRQVMATRLHRLVELVPPTGVPGSARPAGPGHVELAVGWFAGFAADARADEREVASVAATARGRVAAGEVWLWSVAGEPVSLASVSPPAAGVARIGPVFTPFGMRRHGYAGAVTAAALAGGAAEVVLYMDLANPTANGIYRRLGFEPAMESTRVVFEPAATVGERQRAPARSTARSATAGSPPGPGRAPRPPAG